MPSKPTDDRKEVKKSSDVKSRQKRLTSYTMDQTQIMKANVKKLERRYIEVSVIIDRAQYVVLGEFPLSKPFMFNLISSYSHGAKT